MLIRRHPQYFMCRQHFSDTNLSQYIQISCLFAQYITYHQQKTTTIVHHLNIHIGQNKVRICRRRIAYVNIDNLMIKMVCLTFKLRQYFSFNFAFEINSIKQLRNCGLVCKIHSNVRTDHCAKIQSNE